MSLPGLSMIGSPARGESSGMISQPASPRTKDPAARTRIADAGADALRAPALVRRQVGEIGPMALASMEDVVAFGAHRREQLGDRLDRRARQREVVAHAVDITALAAEIGLHVDDDERGILRAEITVPGPGIGLGVDIHGKFE